jgi:flagellar basal body rod protein FlgC
MAITALPTAPSRSDPANFADRGDAFLGALPTFATEANTLASEVNANAFIAQASADIAVNAVNAISWVSGTTYAIGDVRYSTLNFQTYRRKTAGAGTTDPQNDNTNWEKISGINIRSISTASSTSPFSWNSQNYDQFAFTALANALTINADSGTPFDGQLVIFRFKDNGTQRALTWTTGVSKGFRAIGVTLPTTTTISKTLYVGATYNFADSRWDVLAVAEEA